MKLSRVVLLMLALALTLCAPALGERYDPTAGNRFMTIAQYSGVEVVSELVNYEYIHAAKNSYYINFAYADASSEWADAYGEYPAWQAFDGNDGTVWSEGAAGYGIGETLYGCWQVNDVSLNVLGFAIRAGHQRSSDLYYKNSRPKDISIMLCGREYAATLRDEMGWQWVLLADPFEINSYEAGLAITIDSVYAGNKYQDTCISSVDLLVDMPRANGLYMYNTPSVDLLMNDYKFFKRYEGYESINGYAAGRYVNDDGTWTWWTYLSTSNYVNVMVVGIYSGDEYIGMYREAEWDSGVVCYIPGSATVRCYGWYRDWLLCEYGDSHGWVHMDYIGY